MKKQTMTEIKRKVHQLTPEGKHYLAAYILASLDKNVADKLTEATLAKAGSGEKGEK